MTPILQSIQMQLVKTLKNTNIKNELTILSNNDFEIKQRQFRDPIASFVLYVSQPFPQQTLPRLSVLHWSILSLNCTLVRYRYHRDQKPLIQWAETISLFIASRRLSTKEWQGQFNLAEKSPFVKIPWDNAEAIQIHFIAKDFSIAQRKEQPK